MGAGLGHLFGTQRGIDAFNRTDARYDLEGVVVEGSWNPVDGTIQVQEGSSYAILGDDGDQPVIITAILNNTSKGQQGPPVGGERVTVRASQSGWTATLQNSYNESPQTPAGEWWQVHRNAVGEIIAYTKQTNDAFAVGDGLASSQHLAGALHSMETTAGQKIVARDDLLAEAKAGMGIGDDPINLDNLANAAPRQSDIKTALEQYVRTHVGNVLLQYTQAIIKLNGLPSSANATALYTLLATGAGFPEISELTGLIPGIAEISVPNCSPSVLIK